MEKSVPGQRIQHAHAPFGGAGRKVLRGMATFSRMAIDAALPARCLISDELVGQKGQIAPAAWGRVHFIEKPVCACCGVPLPFDPGAGIVCVGCAARTPAYDCARAAFIYNDASRRMILNYKHGGRMDGIAAYAKWMARAGEDVLDMSDLIVPVPLHYTRLVRRRFNQSAILAQRLGGLIGKTAAVDLLKRDRRTPSQFGKNWRDRRRNVAGVFSVRPRWRTRVQGAGVVLIDDVLTTGATVEACAKVLKACGARAVCVLTLARVHSNRDS